MCFGFQAKVATASPSSRSDRGKAREDTLGTTLLRATVPVRISTNQITRAVSVAAPATINDKEQPEKLAKAHFYKHIIVY